MTIGNRIRNLRLLKNISQSNLAKIACISKQTLYKYENDIVTNIPSDKIERLACALQTTPAYLMGWEKTPDIKEHSDDSNSQQLLIETGASCELEATSNDDSVDTLPIKGDALIKLGAYIARYLEEHHLSQRTFSEQCGLSNGYISMLINDNNPKTGRPPVPSIVALAALSKGMGITLDELFSRIDDIPVDVSKISNLYFSKPAVKGKVEDISVRLKRIMEERQLKQVDVLEMAQPYCKQFEVTLNKNDLSQYVSGKVEPGQNKLFVLGLALNVSEAWLMGYDVPMERQTYYGSAVQSSIETAPKGVINKEIGELIQRQRNKLGLTIEDVSQSVGVDMSDVERWERGHISDIGTNKILRLSKTLKVPPEVLSGYGDRSSDEGILHDDSSMMIHDKNMLRLIGRDGTNIRRELTDEQRDMFVMLVKQLPDATDE